MAEGIAGFREIYARLLAKKQALGASNAHPRRAGRRPVTRYVDPAESRKQCRICLKAMPRSRFVRQAAMADGLKSECKKLDQGGPAEP